MDNFIFSFVGGNIGDNTYTPYWQKIGEYCKLRLFGLDKVALEKRIKTWPVQSGFEDCERIYGLLIVSPELEPINEKLGKAQQEYKLARQSVLELNGFK